MCGEEDEAEGSGAARERRKSLEAIVCLQYYTRDACRWREREGGARTRRCCCSTRGAERSRRRDFDRVQAAGCSVRLEQTT